MNSAKIRRPPCLGPLASESERPTSRAGTDRFVRVRVVVFSGSVFGGWMPRHHLRHLHKTRIEQAARSCGDQNQRNGEFPDDVLKYCHLITERIRKIQNPESEREPVCCRGGVCRTVCHMSNAASILSGLNCP